MRRILVTGANGYIGARLSLYLAQQGNKVTALCYPTIPHDESWISLMSNVVIGDIRDIDFIKKMAEDQYDILIHLVSLDHHQSNQGELSFVSSVNVIPTWNLLDVFSKKDLKQFLYFSTIHVYGALQNEIVTEETQPNPTNPYALTHLLSEQICNFYHKNKDVNCSIIRLSNSYGAPIFMENNCWWLVINDLCRMVYLQKEIVLQSDGTPTRDFIHGWDVCKAVETILNDNTKKENNIYHISSGKTYTIEELAKKIRDVYANRYHVDVPIKIAPKTGKKINAYTIDNTKLVSLNYNAEWDLERGIHDLFEYLEKNES